MLIDVHNSLWRDNMRVPLRKLKSDQSGLALVEFAVSLPFFMGLTMSGFETANYAYTVMKLNQLTINIADGAARAGVGELFAERRLTQQHINDVFAGALREGGSLVATKNTTTGAWTAKNNVRIFLSSVEPAAPFDTSGANTRRYRIRWQKCLGGATFTSGYGTRTTATSISAIGPTGRQIVPTDTGAVMFVETRFNFQPLIINGFTKLVNTNLAMTAAMVVRDMRDYNGGTNGVHPVAGQPANDCPA
jgi:Flp pilus assembly protein TadG